MRIDMSVRLNRFSSLSTYRLLAINAQLIWQFKRHSPKPSSKAPLNVANLWLALTHSTIHSPQLSQCCSVAPLLSCLLAAQLGNTGNRQADRWVDVERGAASKTIFGYLLTNYGHN